jgi:hypothetical protein
VNNNRQKCNAMRCALLTGQVVAGSGCSKTTNWVVLLEENRMGSLHFGEGNSG